MIKVKIERFNPDVDDKPVYDTFHVPAGERQMVLTALRHIQDNFDSSLAVRWNCGAGKCGSCAAEVNGKPCLTCKTEVVSGEIVVRPLKAFPVIKDLVTDVGKMWDEHKSIPPFKPKNMSKPWRFYEHDVEASSEFRKCIECFLCQDVCHVLRDHKIDYLGPRWVVKAASLEKHPIDNANRSKFLESKNIWACNVTKCCTDVCPENIRITDNAIIPLKEKTIDDGSILIPLKKLIGI